jgi:hypothetical protein
LLSDLPSTSYLNSSQSKSAAAFAAAVTSDLRSLPSTLGSLKLPFHMDVSKRMYEVGPSSSSTSSLHIHTIRLFPPLAKAVKNWGRGAHGERELKKELSKTEWDLGGMTNDGSKKQVSSLEVMEAESSLTAEV